MAEAGLRETLEVGGAEFSIWNPKRAFGDEGEYGELPYAIRVFLENIARNSEQSSASSTLINEVKRWQDNVGKEVPFFPSRVVLQDATGLPVLVDLASMRDELAQRGLNAGLVNPVIPVDLVVDHSVQVDYFGTFDSLRLNMELEFYRNRERYTFLKWAQSGFSNLRVVPPGKGIIHQINLEYLIGVVSQDIKQGVPRAFPETLIGTDSHTTMISGAGVMGWGVGGIEAESVLLGDPYMVQIPQVVGVRLEGELREGVTTTDAALGLTAALRKAGPGLVGKFVEFFGPGVEELSVEERATISNMAPEYGATTAFFPVDDAVLNYLKLIGKPGQHLELVEAYLKRTGLFRERGSDDPVYSSVFEFDLSSLVPSLAGPSAPDQLIPLSGVKAVFRGLKGTGELKPQEARKALQAQPKAADVLPLKAGISGVVPSFGSAGSTSGSELAVTEMGEMRDGIVALAAVTSCTNTSNPALMIAAGLLAKKAVERGLDVKPWVKTSFAPGSRAVLSYLRASGLMPYLEALRFHVTGFGCTVCIGNSGPLIPEVEKAIKERGIRAVAVLSGNRNYPGRIHPLLSNSFLASPPLVVAYALSGNVDVDLTAEPLGLDPNGRPIYLKDIWPSTGEIREVVRAYLTAGVFEETYSDVYQGSEEWKGLVSADSLVYPWDPRSTYIRRPPFFEGGRVNASNQFADIRGARALLVLGDDVNTDMISPAGPISPDSPAGKYLIGMGVPSAELGNYITRRGNHEVMVRGAFTSAALKNGLVEVPGGWTLHLPDGRLMSVYDAAVEYSQEGTPLIVIAGKRYGAGSSRDWAAKGPALLGVRAVIAESFERIHRSNLIAMGVLPLQFKDGKGWKQLGLNGKEKYDIKLGGELSRGKTLRVRAERDGGSAFEFEVVARLDTPTEVERYRAGGVLSASLKEILERSGARASGSAG